MSKAPRRPSRVWRGLARGAWLTAGLWWAGAAAAEGPVSARYEGPTDRYPHGVLGDAIEYTDLVVETEGGRRLTARWDRPVVFEDVAPRLWDVTGDGVPEIVTVESHEALGARLAIWQAGTDGLDRIAATDWIGTRFRWLAPVGAADLDGDGAIEIAYVDRPHLARVLRVVRMVPQEAGAALVPVASREGFTNHRIGWDHIDGGLRDCGDGPELVLASGDWRDLMAVRLREGIEARVLAPYAAETVARALECR